MTALLALAELLLPATLAWVWARRTPERWLAAAPVALGALAVALDLARPAWDLWDVVAVALSATLGTALGRLPDATTTRLVVSTALFLGAADLAGRVVLPEPPGLQERVDESVRFENAPRLGEFACAFFDPSLDTTGLVDGVTVGPRDAPTVLHIGDSMLGYGPTEPGADIFRDRRRFTYLMAGADAARAHVSASMPGAGWDAYLVAVRGLLTRHPHTAHVVVYFFPGNDLDELHRRYPCCAAPELLDLDDDTLPARCPPWTPAPSSATDLLVLRSPAPLPVRWATHVSPTFAHLRDAVVRHLGARSPLWAERAGQDERLGADAVDAAVDTLDQIVARLAAELSPRGVRLTVVGLPFGPALATPDLPHHVARRAAGDRVRARVEARGVRYLDAWAAFDDTPYEAAWFEADAIHFALPGHQRLATWLAPRLDAP